MAKRTVHHMDFDTLVGVNAQVVSLTGEKNDFSPADGLKIRELLAEVEKRADNLDFSDAVPEKAALLVFKIASGQHFSAGNKRTALVAGVSFLRKNGFTLEMRDPGFVSQVDKVGVAAATLEDLYRVMYELVKKSPTERKGWDKAVTEVVDSNRDFLTEAGA